MEVFQYLETDASNAINEQKHLSKSLTQIIKAGIQSKENLSDVWILNSYREKLLSYSEQYRSDRVNFWKHTECGEYYLSVSGELSTENLNSRMDHRMTEQLARFLSSDESSSRKSKNVN
jgi:hypothetical protein